MFGNVDLPNLIDSIKFDLWRDVLTMWHDLWIDVVLQFYEVTCFMVWYDFMNWCCVATLWGGMFYDVTWFYELMLCYNFMNVTCFVMWHDFVNWRCVVTLWRWHVLWCDMILWTDVVLYLYEMTCFMNWCCVVTLWGDMFYGVTWFYELMLCCNFMRWHVLWCDMISWIDVVLQLYEVTCFYDVTWFYELMLYCNFMNVTCFVMWHDFMNWCCVATLWDNMFLWIDVMFYELICFVLWHDFMNWCCVATIMCWYDLLIL
jgi:hypothetical protein